MFSVLYGNGTESIGRNRVSVSARNRSSRLFMGFSTASSFPDNPLIFRAPIGTYPGVYTSPLLALSILIHRVGFGFCAHGFNRWSAILPGNFGPPLFFFFFCSCFISRLEILK